MKYSSQPQPSPFKHLNFLGFVALIVGLSLSGCASIKNILNQGDQQVVETAQPVAAEEAQRKFAKAAQAMEQQNYPLALQILRGLQLQYPTLSGPWLNEGIILAQQNQCEQAVSVLQKTLQLNPKSQYAYNQLGLCFRTLGQFQQAQAAYLNALDIDASYQIAIYNLAILEELYLRDLAAALKYFRLYQSLQAEPERIVKGWIKDLERRQPKLPTQEFAEPELAQESPVEKKLDSTSQAKKPKSSTSESKTNVSKPVTAKTTNFDKTTTTDKTTATTKATTPNKITTPNKTMTPTATIAPTPTTTPTKTPTNIILQPAAPAPKLATTPAQPPKPAESPKTSAPSKSSEAAEESVFSDDFSLQLEPEPEPQLKQEKATGRASIWR